MSTTETRRRGENLLRKETKINAKPGCREKSENRKVKGLLKGAILLLLMPGFAAAQTHTLMANAADKKLSATPTWELKYKSGALTLQKEQWLKGEFVKEAAGKPSSLVVTISKDQLRSIYFDASAEKNSSLLQGMPRSGCSAAKSLMPKDNSAAAPGLFVIWVSVPGKMARAAEHLNARYPVRLMWNDGGVDKELVVTVDYCEYAAFVANLRWFAGQKWKEIAQPGRATAKN